MNVTQDVLSIIEQTNPGSYAVYRIEGTRMVSLLYSRDLPALSGMTPAEYQQAVAEDAAAVVYSPDRPMVSETLGQLLADGKESQLMYRIVHKTKDYVWIRAKAWLIGTREDDPVLMVSFQDTTQGVEEHAMLLDNTDTWAYVVDAATHEILYANAPMKEFLGLEKFAGLTCYRAINGLDAPCPGCILPKMVHGVFSKEGLYSERTQSWYNARCRAMDWYGRKAAAIYIFDITKEKEQQHLLQLNRDSLENIVNNIPVGVGVCTVKGGSIRALTINPRMTEMMGIPKEDFTANDDEVIARVHPEDVPAVYEIMDSCGIPGINRTADFRFRRDDAYRWYRMLLRTVPYEGGTMAFNCLIDVTGEKEASLEILKGRQMYQTAASASKLVVWQYDPAADRIHMLTESPYTKEVCDKLGIPEIVEKGLETLAQIVDAEDRADFLGMQGRIRAGEEEVSCSFGMETSSGHSYWVLTCTPVKDEGGNLFAVCGIGQDVTLQRREEEQFRKAQQQLLTANPEAMGSFRHNLTTNWTGYGQGRFSEAFGKAAAGSVDNQVNTLASMIEDADARALFLEKFDRHRLLRIFDEGRTQESFVLPLRFFDGRRRWIRGSIQMIRNPASGDVEGVSYAQDITEGKKRDEIADRVIQGELDYVGVISTADGTIELYNKSPAIAYPELHQKADYQACQEYVRSHFVRESDWEQFDAATGLEGIIDSLRENGRYEASYLHTIGEHTGRRQLRCSWLDRAGGEILIMRMDVTAVYEQEQRQLRRVSDALDQARRANAAKSDFLSQMSHDLRTPLNGIIGLSHLAMDAGQEPATVQRYLDEIHRSGEYLLGIINDVLDMSKIESNKLVLRPEFLSFDDFCRTLRDVIDVQCAQKHQRFDIIEPEGGLARYIYVDKTRFIQVFMNLLTNAVKYTPEGGHIELVITHFERRGNRMRKRFTVRDDGIGMAPDFVDHAFKPFVQEHGSDQQSGTGLGLAIVKNLVEEMGGAVWLESTQGEGTAVTIDMEMEVRDTLETAEAPAATASGDLSGARYLVCEDNRINAEVVGALLKKAGAAADYAENGEEGVALFQASPVGYYDAVLMDVRMPRMDGCQATRALRALKRPDAAALPIIALTANAFDEDRQSCLDAGMNDHLAKPIDPASLYRTLQKYRRAGEGSCTF